MAVLVSVITPSRGDRPRALAQAGASLAASVAAARAALGSAAAPEGAVEWLVGFDGVPGQAPEVGLPGRSVTFPRSGGFGNQIRQGLLRAARGGHVAFLDDDNAYTEAAFGLFLRHLDREFIAGRIDVSRAFDLDVLPRRDGGEPIRQGNIDPLCLCCSRELVLTRCGGWDVEGGYESDYLNIRRYWRRARSRVVLDAVVGVYDAGRGLDPGGMNPRQQAREGRPDGVSSLGHPPGGR